MRGPLGPRFLWLVWRWQVFFQANHVHKTDAVFKERMVVLGEEAGNGVWPGKAEAAVKAQGLWRVAGTDGDPVSQRRVFFKEAGKQGFAVAFSLFFQPGSNVFYFEFPFAFPGNNAYAFQCAVKKRV